MEDVLYKTVVKDLTLTVEGLKDKSWDLTGLTEKSRDYLKEDIETQTKFSSKTDFLNYVNDLFLAVTEQEEIDDLGEPEDEEKTPKKMDVPQHYRALYGTAQNNGDEVSQLLQGQSLSLVEDDNGIDVLRWQHLNNGQHRMNLGNVLRGRIRKGEKVIIGGRTWKDIGEDNRKAMKLAKKILKDDANDKEIQSFITDNEALILKLCPNKKA